MSRMRDHGPTIREFRKRRQLWLRYSVLFTGMLLLVASATAASPGLGIMLPGISLVLAFLTPWLLRGFVFVRLCPSCNTTIYPQRLWSSKEEHLLPPKCPKCRASWR